MASRCPFQPGTTVTAYLRDSGGTKQETSTDRQEKEVRAWCGEHRLILTHCYIDEARTGRTDKGRDSLVEMMEHFRNGAGEAGVIIWNYERFARNTKHGRYYIAELEYLGKLVHSLTDDIPEGEERIIFQAFKLYSAAQTSNKISIDVKSGLRKMIEEHGGMPGTPPRGFKREPVQIGLHRDRQPRIVHKWIPDPDTIAQVRTAFEMRANGETLRRIQEATHLYTSANSWVTFFANPIYKGELHYGEDIVLVNYCEPIVDPITWERANETGRRRTRIQKDDADHPRRLTSSAILSGLVHCSECGSLMSKHWIKQWEYYVCTNRRMQRGCTARHIPQGVLESGVINLVLDQLLSLDVMLAIQHKLRIAHHDRTGDHEGERLAHRRKLSRLTKRIYNLTDAIADLGISPGLKAKLLQAEREAVEVQGQLKALDAAAIPPPEYAAPTLAQLADQIRHALLDEDRETRRHYLRGIITRIEARRDDDHIHGALYYIPPQTLLGKGAGAPTEERTDYLTIDLLITRKKRAPL